MLNTAVRALKAGEEPDLDSPFTALCEVNLHASALLPADYCPDVHARLSFYKKLSHADSEDGLIGIQEELIDRYGKLPEAAQNLLATHRLRLHAEPLGVIKIDASEAQAMIQFNAKPNVDPLRIIQLIQTRRNVKLAGQDKIKIDIKPSGSAKQAAPNAPQAAPVNARIEAVRDVLKALA